MGVDVNDVITNNALDLETLPIAELIQIAESLNINRLDLLGHGSKRETWIKAIQGWQADQKYFQKWLQSQNQKQKDLPLCSNTPEEN